LKRLKFILAGPLSIVYAHIFFSRKIPSAWRIANITPVFKHGISSDVSNYRPISLTSSILLKAFTTYVRPMVEYCSPIWSPVAVTLINQLESLQRRFTKRLPGFQTLPYDERCALLRLDRLELRRLRADLILCYKIIRGLVLLSPDSFLRLFAIQEHVVIHLNCFT